MFVFFGRRSPVFLLWTALPFAAPAAGFAHEITVRPATVELKVDPEQIRVEVRVHPTYWMEEVLDVRGFPPGEWPPELKARAEKYLDGRLLIAPGAGRPAGIRWTEFRYIENPWQVKSGGTIRIRGVAGASPGRLLEENPEATLGVGSLLHGEAYPAPRGSAGPAEDEEAERALFRTDIFIRGRRPLRLETFPAMGRPLAVVRLADALRTPKQALGEHFGRGFRLAGTRVGLVLFVVAGVLRWVLPGPKTARAAFPVALAGMILACPAVPLVTASFPGSFPEILSFVRWFHVLLLCAAAYRRWPVWLWSVPVGTGVTLWAAELGRNALILEVPASLKAAAAGFFFAGAAALCLVCKAAAGGALFLHRRHIGKIYPSAGERIFAGHVRFLTQLVAIVSLYFIIRHD